MDIDQQGRVASVPNREPVVEIIKRAEKSGPRLGVFASSFNPPTNAHVELMRSAAQVFSLDQTLALAGRANADKREYECSLGDRLAMLKLAVGDQPTVSIGLSSHAFYVDMVEAIEREYPALTDLHFIVGFDTFVRVIDLEDRYTPRYHRQFRDRVEALEYLFDRSRFIVAGRSGTNQQSVKQMISREPALPAARIAYLDFPGDLGEISATEARNRIRTGRSLVGFVPAGVEQYITEHLLYAT